MEIVIDRETGIQIERESKGEGSKDRQRGG